MINKKIFYITGGVSVLVVFFASIILVTRSVVGFDLGGFSSRDCVPYNVFISKGDNDHTAVIEWSTKGSCVGFVQYGRERGSLDLVAIDVENESKAKSHVVQLEGLLSKEVYFFLINSQEQAYGNNGIPLEFSLMDL